MLVSTAGYQDGKQLCQPGFGQPPAEQGSSYVERYVSNGAQLSECCVSGPRFDSHGDV